MPGFAKNVQYPQFKLFEYEDEDLRIKYEPYTHMHDSMKE